MKKIATIGFFDGVHRGHQYLFEHLRELAAEKDLTPLVVTFDRHPRSILHADFVPQLLTTSDERLALLRQEVSDVLVLDFAEIQSLTAAEFLTQLRDEHDVAMLLMGYDHQFGSDRLHRPQDYRRIGEQFGVEIVTMGEYSEGEWHVSSTEIRQTLENGNVAVANELLGRPYELSGVVVHGKGIGRTIGFPTANIQPECAEKIVPKAGVYIVKVKGEKLKEEGERSFARGILNIGTNPTVGNTERTIELHLPLFRGDLYGQRLTILFERFLREEQKFPSLKDLQQKIKEDLASLTSKH